MKRTGRLHRAASVAVGRAAFSRFGIISHQTRPPHPAKALVDKHVGVIAWSREANPEIGEYGPPTTLFVSGDVPDME